MVPTHETSLASVKGVGRILGGLLLILLGVGWLIIGEDDILDTVYPAPDTYKTHAPLFAPRTVGQTFRAEANNMSAIGLYLAPYTQKQPTGRIMLHLRSSPDTRDDLRRAVIPALAVKKDSEERFLFDPIPGSSGKIYYLELEYPDGASDHAVGVQFETPENTEGREYGAGERYLDREPAGGDLGFALYHRERPMLGVQLASGLIVAGLALLAQTFFPNGTGLAVILVGLPLLSLLPLFHNIQFLGRENWNPVIVASPISLQAALLPLIGPVVGTKVSMALHSIIGFMGFFFLLRYWSPTRQRAAPQHTTFLHRWRGGRNPASGPRSSTDVPMAPGAGSRTSTLAALLGATTFLFSTFFALHFAYGQAEIAALGWTPWLILFAHRASRDRRFIALTILSAGLLIAEGGVGVALPALLFALIVSIRDSRRSRSSSFGVFTILFIAVVVLVIPMLDPAANLPKAAAYPAAFPPRLAIDVLLDPRQVGFVEKFAGQTLPWVEYGAYVGIFSLSLGLLGALRHPVRLLPFIAAGGSFALVAFSSRVQQFLGPLVFFDDPKAAQRSIALVVFAIGILAAHGFDALLELVDIPEVSRSRGTRAVTGAMVGLLVVMVITDLLVVGAPAYLTTFIAPPAPVMVNRVGWSPDVIFGLLLALIGTLASGILWTRSRRSGMLLASRS